MTSPYHIYVELSWLTLIDDPLFEKRCSLAKLRLKSFQTFYFSIEIKECKVLNQLTRMIFILVLILR